MLSIGDLVFIIDFSVIPPDRRLSTAIYLGTNRRHKHATVLCNGGFRNPRLTHIMDAQTFKPIWQTQDGKGGIHPSVWATLLERAINDGLITRENLAAVRDQA